MGGFLDELEVGKVDGRFNAALVLIVGTGFKLQFSFFPFSLSMIKFSSKCFMQITEFEVGDQSARLTNFIHVFIKSGLLKKNKHDDTVLFSFLDFDIYPDL